MDYKDKLRLAKEALDSGSYDKETIEYIFPELKESDDEKIRKALLEMVHDTTGDSLWIDYNVHKEDAIDWLEKQGEQKPAEFDDTNAKRMFIKALERVEEQNNKGYKLTDCDKNSWWEDFKAYTSCIVEQKPWSEEEEKKQNYLIALLQNSTMNNPALRSVNEGLEDWLKSLKDRVQPKQEWKQENTEELSDFENVMMHIGNSFFGQHAGLDPNDTDAIKKQANLLLELVPKQEWSEDTQQWIDAIIFDYESWYDADKDHRTTILAKINILKSLKERCTWKPSDEQMNALHYVTNFDYGGHKSTLVSLYEQLKKLK